MGECRYTQGLLTIDFKYFWSINFKFHTLSVISKLNSYSKHPLPWTNFAGHTCKRAFWIGKWVHYDGLTEKQCPGSGLSVQHILAQLGTPSHCFYAQLWGTQCRSGLKKGWAKIIRAIFQLDHDQLTSILLSHLFWIFQSTFKLQLMILAAITTLWAFLNCFLLFLAIFLINKLRNEEGKNILQRI